MLDYKGFLYLYIINIVKSQYFEFYNYVNFIYFRIKSCKYLNLINLHTFILIHCGLYITYITNTFQYI